MCDALEVLMKRGLKRAAVTSSPACARLLKDGDDAFELLLGILIAYLSLSVTLLHHLTTLSLSLSLKHEPYNEGACE